MPNPRALPAGRTCADCVHWTLCNVLTRVPLHSTLCDANPALFLVARHVEDQAQADAMRAIEIEIAVEHVVRS